MQLQALVYRVDGHSKLACSALVFGASIIVIIIKITLTVGFESNFMNNAVRKKEKYLNLIKEMSRSYRCV